MMTYAHNSSIQEVEARLGLVAHDFNPRTVRKQWQGFLWVWAILVYIESSKIARTTKRDPVSKQNKTNKKHNQPNKQKQAPRKQKNNKQTTKQKKKKKK